MLHTCAWEKEGVRALRYSACTDYANSRTGRAGASGHCAIAYFPA